MDSQAIKQIVLVERAATDESMAIERAALFNENGTAFEGYTGPAGADGSDNVTGLVTIPTVSGTAAKTTTSEEPAAGTLVPIKFTEGNVLGSFTVSFNGGTARTVKVAASDDFGTKLSFDALAVCVFYFDGTILHAVGPILP